MGNNFFLTGDLHVGKSTIINRITRELSLTRISGFQTSRFYEKDKLHGFYIERYNTINDEMDKQFIGKCINQDRWVSIPSTFDKYGVQILNDAVEKNTELIIMDELGFFENEAMLFQKKVSSILDSDIPVLGVVKQKQTLFLDSIRNRNDVVVFNITKQNREIMYYEILQQMKSVLNQQEEKKYNIDALAFDKIAREVFAPVYPAIAKQIKEKTQKYEGKCLDIGSGTGYLGIELAKITELKVYLLDISKEMLNIADKNIKEANLEDRIQSIEANVQNIPFGDNYFDLVISRGSLFFWEDKESAFKEIYRVLAPGGIAFIGGGFGTREIKRKIDVEMQKRDQYWRKNINNKVNKTNISYDQVLDAVEISNYYMINNDANMWIVFEKQSNKNVVTAYI